MPVVTFYFSRRRGSLPWMEAGKEAGGMEKRKEIPQGNRLNVS
jgi:hypothetical protein